MKMPTRYLGLQEQMSREVRIREVVWEGISLCWQEGAESHEDWVSCSALLREQKEQMLWKEGERVWVGETIKQLKGETANARHAEKPSQGVMSWTINKMSLVCLAKAAFVGGSCCETLSREEWGREEEGWHVLWLPSKNKMEQRADLLHFNWVSLLANKNVKSKLKLQNRREMKLSHKWRVLERWKGLFNFSLGLSDYF